MRYFSGIQDLFISVSCIAVQHWTNTKITQIVYAIALASFLRYLRLNVKLKHEEKTAFSIFFFSFFVEIWHRFEERRRY